MKTIEVMKQALDAIYSGNDDALSWAKTNLMKAIDRKEAQNAVLSVEPVMYGIQFGTGAFASYAYPSKEDAEKLSDWSHKPNKVIPLFTRPAPAPIGERVALLNLLARIHRDGGHYTNEYGLDKSVAEADKIIADILAADIKP